MEFNKELVEKYKHMIEGLAATLGKTKDKFKIEELASAGLEGLYKATVKYKEEKGISFSTFAYIKIKGAILDELRKTSWVSTRKKDFKNIKIEFIDENYYSMDDFEAFEEGVENREEAESYLEKILPILSKEELEIIKMRFYFDLTFQDISNVLGIDESTIGAIVKKALEKLRSEYERQNGEATR